MALLLRDSEAPAEGAPPTGSDGEGQAPAAPESACTNCGTTMGSGQDWCLECGAAAPGRLGARPAGWRAAFTLVATTLLLVGGAVVASYAALTSDAEREATRPSQGSGAPIVAAPPPTGAPVAPAAPTGPGTEQQTAPARPTPRPTRPLPAQPAPAPATPAAPAPAAPDAPSAPPPPQVVGIDLAADAARTYDPYSRPGAEFGAARNATDDDPETVWDVTFPADNESPRVGLVVDLGRAATLDSLQISSPTAGFRAEIYGTTAAGIPPDIIDKRWQRLTGSRAVEDGERISLKGKGDGQMRRLVVWLTAVPDAADPRVAIGEVAVRGTR